MARNAVKSDNNVDYENFTVYNNMKYLVQKGKWKLRRYSILFSCQTSIYNFLLINALTFITFMNEQGK